MTTIKVTRIDKQLRDGLYPVWGFREGDLLERLVIFYAARPEAEELFKLIKSATPEDPLTVEVDNKAWAFVITRKEAA